MTYFAVFVDAGNLLAWGADRRIGTRATRAAVRCHHAQLIEALVQHCGSLARRELLRVYWYDGAPDQLPTAEHISIGQQDSVKVRLGRLTSRGQKGVDTLIVLDLTTLARECAIDVAFLLSGDEDLREAVLATRQLGVRVVLLGLAPTPAGQGRQSQSLMREADVCSDITSLVDPFFEHIRTPAYLAGLAYGKAWLAEANASDAQQLRSLGLDTLPASMLSQLRSYMRQSSRVAAVQEWHEREARRGFLDALATARTLTSALN